MRSISSLRRTTKTIIKKKISFFFSAVSFALFFTFGDTWAGSARWRMRWTRPTTTPRVLVRAMELDLANAARPRGKVPSRERLTTTWECSLAPRAKRGRRQVLTFSFPGWPWTNICRTSLWRVRSRNCGVGNAGEWGLHHPNQARSAKASA